MFIMSRVFVVTKTLKTAHAHVMPSLHVCNGLVRPPDESMLTRDNRTTEHSENIIVSAAHSLRRHNNAGSEINILIHCKLLTCGDAWFVLRTLIF